MKSQSSPIYTFEEMQEVKNEWKLSIMYHQLFIIVAIVVGFALGLLY